MLLSSFPVLESLVSPNSAYDLVAKERYLPRFEQGGVVWSRLLHLLADACLMQAPASERRRSGAGED